MQMGSKFPGGEEGGCTRAARRCKFPPGRERVTGCGEFWWTLTEALYEHVLFTVLAVLPVAHTGGLLP